MALRRKVAEKLSRVTKRAGLKTPILDEIPLKAEVIEALDFPLARVRGIIPVIAKGKAYGATAGRWYKVTFPRGIIDPSVVCVALARKGEIPRPRDIPSIAELAKILKEKIPDLSIPKWYVHMPTADDFVSLAKGFFGDWGPLNWMRDAIAWAFGNYEYAIWNTLFRPRGLDKMNEVLSKTQDAINDRLERIRTIFNTKLGEIDDRLDTLRTKTNDSLKTLFPRLYEAWGLRTDMALTALNTRNITDWGFEFLSMGDTACHWIAVGSRR